MKEISKNIRKKPSGVWYLVLILICFIYPMLGIVVGIIGYLFFKDKHPKFAKQFLIIAIIVCIVFFVIQTVLVGLAYIYISNIITSKTASMINLVDSSCSDGIITAIISNQGTMNIPISSIEFFLNGQKTIPSGCSGYIEPRSTVACNLGSDLSGSQMIEIRSTSNTETGSVWC